jgi:hypothetical protein
MIDLYLDLIPESHTGPQPLRFRQADGSRRNASIWTSREDVVVIDKKVKIDAIAVQREVLWRDSKPVEKVN